MVPIVVALFNRFGRGEGLVPRWAWYALMVDTALIVCAASKFNLYELGAFTASWLIFFLGYALLAWQAMFSAVHGKPPARKDPGYINWMQDLAYFLSRAPQAGTPASAIYNYRLFGIIYGTIRATTMIPGILMLCWITRSSIPLDGLFVLAMGLVYYGAGKLSKHLTGTPYIGEALAEIGMGWWLGTYMQIVSSAI